MQQYERLKQLLRDLHFIPLLIVTGEFRPVNKNVSTGAVIRVKQGTDRARHS